ncbi:protein-L-isoaspartate(D-aspartate) O-methyltransferase [Fervidobacterium thailandense]|uniref:Protein-L-isoaspartate O-methyltransferase n=1 Tax=Fervidobacterium thailandense TaxID=1008305 RepID=A0A1E3G645_9BACT|nr:protein-L-isoaspartate(D-aspartate) O-methyltransferase [Fervidobacterium thailandense]ODN31343.1 protein-L-isoaspartate O-methyltransferase [Fervidobacterium thailandense]
MYEHLRYYGVSERVINAMNMVDRKLFVPEEFAESAYLDVPLPIGHGQTISAPHMVGIMCQKLELSEGQKVLEIGTGSGYNAAVLSVLVGQTGKVYTVEIVPELAEKAIERFKLLGIENVYVFVGDGKEGLPAFAPYDRIVATCYAKRIPPPLIEQLSEGGILLIPVGNEYAQTLKKVVKTNAGIEEFSITSVRFVPMV